MSRRPIWPLFLGLAALVVVLDQITKAWLTSFLAPGQVQSVVGDYIRLVHGQNNGALFGLFRESALLFGTYWVMLLFALNQKSAYLQIFGELRFRRARTQRISEAATDELLKKVSLSA